MSGQDRTHQRGHPAKDGLAEDGVHGSREATGEQKNTEDHGTTEPQR